MLDQSYGDFELAIGQSDVTYERRIAIFKFKQWIKVIAVGLISAVIYKFLPDILDWSGSFTATNNINYDMYRDVPNVYDNRADYGTTSISGSGLLYVLGWIALIAAFFKVGEEFVNCKETQWEDSFYALPLHPSEQYEWLGKGLMRRLDRRSYIRKGAKLRREREAYETRAHAGLGLDVAQPLLLPAPRGKDNWVQPFMEDYDLFLEGFPRVHHDNELDFLTTKPCCIGQIQTARIFNPANKNYEQILRRRVMVGYSSIEQVFLKRWAACERQRAQRRYDGFGNDAFTASFPWSNS